MNILIVGDSNTYGYAAGGGRLIARDRWPDILRGLRPADQIRVDGANGRYLNGRVLGLAGLLDGHGTALAALARQDADALILQLGSNDLLADVGAAIVADRLDALLDDVRAASNAAIFVITPSAIDPLDEDTAFGPAWMVSACRAAAMAMALVAHNHGAHPIPCDDCACDPWDGLHLAPAGHQELARRIHNALKRWPLAPENQP